MKPTTPGKFARRDEGECHPHGIPSRVTTNDYDSRRRAYDQKLAADHARWAKGKRRRLARNATRRAQRAAMVALALIVVVTGACSTEPDCKEKKLSDGTICLVCTHSDLDGTNRKVETSCGQKPVG